MFIRFLLSSVPFIAVLFGLSNCSSNSTTLGINDNAVAIDTVKTDKWLAAKENFDEYCTSCHGHEVNAFVDREWKHGNTKEAISLSIKNGIIDNGMPAYDTTFTETEINELAEYILVGIANRESYDNDKEETPKYYDTELLRLKIDTVVSDLGIPWGLKVTADGTIYVTEKAGILSYKKPGQDIVQVIGVPKVLEGRQGGLLDIALHPEFDENQLLYLAYSKSTSGDNSTTAVIRAKLDGNRLVDIMEIFEAVPSLNSIYHYGCRMVFDKDGYLYITIGDRARRDEHPQSLTNSCGKIHRLHDDGRIPNDNPFVDQPSAIPSIWSYGHRNPQGLIYNVSTDEIWETEHGPRGGDELNLIHKGLNYGWPIISYGLNYNGTTFTQITEKEGMEQPSLYWTPSIAPSGMALVTGSNYGAWEGNILAGSLRFNYVSRVAIEGGKVTGEERVLEGIGRVRAVEMGQDGYLYISVESPGRILKVTID